MMVHINFSNTLRRGMLALALAACTGVASADTLHVEIDTTSFGGKGWIDLLFNASSTRAALATASLSNFVGFDATAGAETIGGVGGSLAGGYTLSNLNGGADLFHGVNFGGKVSFNVDFAGSADASVNRALSTLSVSLYGADKTTLLGNGDAASGSLVMLNWLPSKTGASEGTVSTRIFDNIASVGPASPVAPVPEPSTWLMLGAGLGLVALARRRKINEAFVASAS